MPRQARIDVPGALHHIICRGIERRKIFFNDVDRDDFVQRLSHIIIDSDTLCMSVDPQSFSFAASNRQRSNCHRHAPIAHRLCGQL